MAANFQAFLFIICRNKSCVFLHKGEFLPKANVSDVNTMQEEEKALYLPFYFFLNIAQNQQLLGKEAVKNRIWIVLGGIHPHLQVVVACKCFKLLSDMKQF